MVIFTQKTKNEKRTLQLLQPHMCLKLMMAGFHSAASVSDVLRQHLLFQLRVFGNTLSAPYSASISIYINIQQLFLTHYNVVVSRYRCLFM